MNFLTGHDIHPFLKGNFGPVVEEFISHPCEITQGEVPVELLGGQYIRNGGNPVYPPEKGRHYHWFDGDGMLHGVLFPTAPDAPPLYTNRHLATPLLALTLLILRSPIPSIGLLISPLSSLHRIVAAIIQAFFLAVRARMGVLSVANTSVIWWGQGLGREAEEEAAVEASLAEPFEESVGSPRSRRRDTLLDYQRDHRLLATCESGPPLEVRVPELETVSWDRLEEPGTRESLAYRRGKWAWWKRWGLSRVQEDWMTAHPRIDPVDGSLIFYSTQMFDAPHARYSVIDRKGKHLVWKEGVDVGRAKMMHDFAPTRTHTILLNLPLTLAPHNLFSVPPVPLIHFDRTLPSEFIVFPRLLRSPETPREPIRFTEPEPSLIFHTANAWDEYEGNQLTSVNMLGCRFKSAKLVYAAAAVEAPQVEMMIGENDTVRLHYYRFAFPPDYNYVSSSTTGVISHSFPLTGIPFEFPIVPTDLAMSACRYVYGCTMSSGSFDERLAGAAKVDCLVKIDVRGLIQRGRARGEGKNMDPVDGRSSWEIIQDCTKGIKGPIEIFALPQGWYAQEGRFVPRVGSGLAEDDGYLLTYVYDENYLLPDGTPSVAADAGSELWVIDAKRMGDGMHSVVCRIKLPQRVPYGFHGTWLPPSLTRHQRPRPENLLDQPLLQDKLAISRLRQFASVLSARPTHREKSRIETAFLAVFWPASVGILALAAIQVMTNQTRSRWQVGDALKSATNHTTAMPLDEKHRQLRTVPWPLLASALLSIVVFVLRSSSKRKRTSTPPLQEIRR